jgi:hypothetical protein
MTHTTNRHADTTALIMRLAAACRDPRHHCALVLAANAGLVACGAAEPFTPALALHLVLLPFNLWRLLHAMRASPSVSRVSAAKAKSDLASTRQRVESMRCAALDARATMQTVRLSPRHQGE